MYVLVLCSQTIFFFYIQMGIFSCSNVKEKSGLATRDDVCAIFNRNGIRIIPKHAHNVILQW